MNVVIVLVVEEEEVVEGEVEEDVEDTWEVEEEEDVAEGDVVLEAVVLEAVVVEEEEAVAAAVETHLETKRMVPLLHSLETKLHSIKSQQHHVGYLGFGGLNVL